MSAAPSPAPAGLTLWGRANAINVFKVLWLADELGLTVQRIDAGLQFGRTDEPGYRAMNPTGKVPTLEHDGHAIWESNTICRYLVGIAGRADLLPGAPAERAAVETWMDWSLAALTNPMATLAIAYLRTAPEARDMAAIARDMATTIPLWTMIDAQLADRAWLALGQFTLADVAVGLFTHRWLKLPLPGRPDLPHLQAYYERLRARPPFVARVCA